MRPIKDPAPSRFAYKLNRLLLRRGMRRFLRLGLPLLLVAACVAIWASDATRVEDARDRLANVKRQIEERPEFMVHMMAIEDASSPVAADVREVLSLDFPMSSFDLDLDEIKSTVEGLNAVASASVHIRSGGVLSVAVAERMPVAVWRNADGLQLIDAEGHPVQGLAMRTERPELPLLVGKGADRAITEALDLFQRTAPLQNRLRGLVRVGERRWDLVLDNDQRVLLPEDAPAIAFQHVLKLDAEDSIFDRDVSVIDMRNPARPVLRLGNTGIEGLFETEFNRGDGE